MSDIQRIPEDQHQAPDSSPAPDLSSAPVPGELLPREKEIVDAVYSRVEARIEYREHQGPLPAPEDFASYASLIPDGANRLMRMAEKEQEFQHEKSRRQECRATIGVVSAFSIVISVCTLCGYGFYLGHPVEAAGVFGATLVSVVGTFVYGTSIGNKRKKDESTAIEKADAETKSDD